MAGTLLHPAGDQDLVPALIARVLELEATVSSIASLVADSYRAAGEPVPSQFAPRGDLHAVS